MGYAVKAGQPTLRRNPVINNASVTRGTLCRSRIRIIIMIAVNKAVNSMVGLRLFRNTLSDNQPPTIDPIKPPIHGAAATIPIFINKKCFSLTR
jgi:hypothetical protein